MSAGLSVLIADGHNDSLASGGTAYYCLHANAWSFFYATRTLQCAAHYWMTRGSGECCSMLHALSELCTLHAYAPYGQARGADACSSELDLPVGQNWIAVGDAAVAYDPLSSKGISNALYTGCQAANALIASGNGDADAPARYAAHVRDIHRVYRDQLHDFYSMERRWPESTFWRRRKGG